HTTGVLSIQAPSDRQRINPAQIGKPAEALIGRCQGSSIFQCKSRENSVSNKGPGDPPGADDFLQYHCVPWTGTQGDHPRLLKPLMDDRKSLIHGSGMRPDFRVGTDPKKCPYRDPRQTDGLAVRKQRFKPRGHPGLFGKPGIVSIEQYI